MGQVTRAPERAETVLCLPPRVIGSEDWTARLFIRANPLSSRQLLRTISNFAVSR